MFYTFGANAHLVLRIVLEETLDATAWELNNKAVSTTSSN
jgi:hypothetical protein